MRSWTLFAAFVTMTLSRLRLKSTENSQERDKIESCKQGRLYSHGRVVSANERGRLVCVVLLKIDWPISAARFRFQKNGPSSDAKLCTHEARPPSLTHARSSQKLFQKNRFFEKMWSCVEHRHESKSGKVTKAVRQEREKIFYCRETELVLPIAYEFRPQRFIT